MQIFSVGFHFRPKPEQKGARDFVFWHWAQIQYFNPTVQLVKHKDMTVTPFAKAFLGESPILRCLFLLVAEGSVLEDGREVLFDLENLDREQIVKVVSETLGKTERVLERERLESIAHINPASFGSKFDRHCMCEIQGQHPCTSLVYAPQCLKGRWRWNHNML